jgi:hypothetical protein
VTNPLETPEGISFPASTEKSVAYLSDKALLITVGDNQQLDRGRSLFAISKMLDDKSLAKV